MIYLPHFYATVNLTVWRCDMADSNQRLSMTVGLIAVALFLQLFQINALWGEILLSVLVLSLFIPSILEYRKVKILSEKNQRLFTQNQKQLLKINQLTKNHLSLQSRLSGYKTLLEDLDSIAFTFDFKIDKCLFFPGTIGKQSRIIYTKDCT
jgi:hypothetical protein